jgi:Ca2+-binding EF-hand superfamily protein
MMKLLAGGAIAALAIAVAPALAQSAPPPPPGVAPGTAMVAPVRPVPQVQNRMHMMMMSDRTMTRDEVLRHVREIFSRLDTNRDGYVTREELEGFHRRFANMGTDMHRRIEGHGAMMGDRGAMFDRLDANHDGVISRQEFMAAAPEVRERRVLIMRDGAGEAGMPGMEGMNMRMPGMGMHGMGMHAMGGGFGAHLFEMADTNRDGRVSLQEAEAAVLQHFDRADLNHDGRITPDERRQAHELMRRERRPS